MSKFRKAFAVALSAYLIGACAPAESVSDELTPPTITMESGLTPAQPATTQATTTTTAEAPTTTQEPTTSVPSQGTSTTVHQTAAWDEGEAEAALGTVESFYEALNSGDVEHALEFLVDRTHSADLKGRLRIAVEGLNAQFSYDCTPGSTGGLISCEEYVTDDLYGPAGITNGATVSYRYGEGKLIVSGWHRPFVCEAEPRGDAGTFLMEFRVWAAQAHPELERYWHWGEPIDSRLAIPCTVYPFTHSENAIKVCEIVPEFVAQSDNWPTDNA